MSGTDWLAELRRATGRFADVLATGDLAAPVAACPGWTLHDLADHLGSTHHWAAHAVVAGTPNGETGPAPSGREDLLEWYLGHAARLHDVLAERAADAPAWTFGAPATVLFWRRRQVHETLMHTWDAEASQGTPQPFEPALAWDGAREVAEVFYPRQVQLGRIAPLPGALRLVATDVDGHVVIGEGDPVEVRATSDALLRLLWHRADPAVEGVDPRAVRLLAVAITP